MLAIMMAQKLEPYFKITSHSYIDSDSGILTQLTFSTINQMPEKRYCVSPLKLPHYSLKLQQGSLSEFHELLNILNTLVSFVFWQSGHYEQ